MLIVIILASSKILTIIIIYSEIFKSSILSNFCIVRVRDLIICIFLIVYPTFNLINKQCFCMRTAHEREGDGGDQPERYRPYEKSAGGVSQTKPAKQIKS